MYAIALSGILLAVGSLMLPSSDQIPPIDREAIAPISFGELRGELRLDRKKEQSKMPEYLIILMRSASLDSRWVGRGGVRTDTYKAYERAAAAGNSIRPQLETMVQTATPACRIYAAILLHRIDRLTGEKALSQLQSDQSQVDYINGCIFQKLKVSELATKILQGENIVH